jgi:hypothetical protein
MAPAAGINFSQKKRKRNILIQISMKIPKTKVNIDQANFEKVDDFKEVTTDRVEQIWKLMQKVDVTAGTTIRGVDLTTMMGINNLIDLIAIGIKIGITINIKQT